MFWVTVKGSLNCYYHQYAANFSLWFAFYELHLDE